MLALADVFTLIPVKGFDAIDRLPTPTGWAYLFLGWRNAKFVGRIANGGSGLRALGVTERAWVAITGDLDAADTFRGEAGT